MKWFSISILITSLVEAVLLGLIGSLYWELVSDPTPASDQFQGFGLMMIFVGPIITIFALITSALFIATYFSSKKQSRKMPKLMLVSGILFGIIPAIISVGLYALSFGGEAYYNHAVSNIKITDMHDELLLSPKGNPMGIRLTYTARFPSKNNYFMSNAVSAAGPDQDRYSLIDDMQVYGPPIITPPATNGGNMFDGKQSYTFVVNLIPYIYKYKTKESDGNETWAMGDYGYYQSNAPLPIGVERCFAPAPFDVNQSDFKSNPGVGNRFWVLIKATGDVVSDTFTKGLYSMAMFHEGAVKDGVLPCPAD